MGFLDCKVKLFENCVQTEAHVGENTGEVCQATHRPPGHYGPLKKF